MASDDRNESTYRSAGVDLEAAEEAVDRYRESVRNTRVPGVLADVGGFGGLFSLRDAGIELDDPVLVSATDGVGTKLKLAFALDRHDTIGVDCVAMCVNDVATTGARPLFFLDYLATGRLDPEQAAGVVEGIARACKECECALIGGETAEMPGFYADGEYDVAGFCVGVVDRARILSPESVCEGDALIGVGSSGFHSNGFSLVRKIVDDCELDLRASYPELGEATLGERLLEPTRLYVRALRATAAAVELHGAAHITGGGFYENLPRMLPDGLGAVVDPARWERDPIFDFIAERGNVAVRERYRVFNMGIGMVFAVAADRVGDALMAMRAAHYDAWHIGEVVAGEGVTVEGID